MKKEIERRAEEAGMEFDREDIAVARDEDMATVFLSRTRKAVYDESGEQIEWEYSPLLWAVYSPVWSIAGREDVELYLPRVHVLCPWLVMIRFEDGTVKDGKHDNAPVSVENILSQACDRLYFPEKPE